MYLCPTTHNPENIQMRALWIGTTRGAKVEKNKLMQKQQQQKQLLLLLLPTRWDSLQHQCHQRHVYVL